MTNHIKNIAYCDTSFLLEYWQTIISDENDWFSKIEKFNRPKYFDYIVDVLKSDKRQKAVLPFKLLLNDLELEDTLISSFIALTELHEKYAEWNMKQIIADSSGIDKTFSKGKKDIATIISKIFSDKGDLRDSIFSSLFPNNFNESFLGIRFLDLKEINFSISDFYSKYYIYSVMQLGTTDILHLIAAKHLNANFFFTFDNDFVRVQDIVKEDFGITIVSTEDQLKQFLKNHR